MIPAQWHPGGDPATVPIPTSRVVDLTELIPTQRSTERAMAAPRTALRRRGTPAAPNPVLVRQLAARPRLRPSHLGSVLVGVGLVALVLLVLLLG